MTADNICLIAVAASIVLFLIASGAQLSIGNIKLAALYGCFALTNGASVWLAIN